MMFFESHKHVWYFFIIAVFPCTSLARRLYSMQINDVSVWVYRNPLAQMEEEKRDHEVKMKKMESEMEQVFEMKVREKKQKLRDSEADVSFYIATIVTKFCL